MRYRVLGRTGLRVSAIAFGAGPVSTLMVNDDVQRQIAVVDHSIRSGINWFDTAATYGDGRSERSLGRAIEELGAAGKVHVATKVRLLADDWRDVRGAVRRSIEGSLDRLRLPRVTLLQLHNSITAGRGDEPTSLTPADVLGRDGVLDQLEQLRSEGLTLHLGLTGIGQAHALRQVIRSGRFATMQVPYHLLNPSAGQAMHASFAESNYGNVIADCAAEQMGVFAIRVFAAGALLDNPPSPHTLKTPFFPLALYERDRVRAKHIRATLARESLQGDAIRFALGHADVASALIGFAGAEQIDQAITALESQIAPLTWEEIESAEPRQDSL